MDPVVHDAVPRRLLLVRRNVTVTVAPLMLAFVVLCLMVTVRAGRQPLPLVSDDAAVALMNERGATVVLVVVVGGRVVVVVGAAGVVVGGRVGVGVGGAVVVVVVGAAVVDDEPPGRSVPVGVSPLDPGRAPMRLLVVS